MKLSHLAICAAVSLATGSFVGCQCGDPDGGTVPGSDPAAGGDVTETTGDAAEAAGEDSGVSAEVRQVIDAGDAGAIAVELEKRATQLRTLVGETEKRAGELEVTAESMTGRKETVDPRDPAVVDTLVASAASLAEGTGSLEQEVAEARQLTADLVALADALYGRPAEAAAAPATEAPSADAPAPAE